MMGDLASNGLSARRGARGRHSGSTARAHAGRFDPVSRSRGRRRLPALVGGALKLAVVPAELDRIVAARQTTDLHLHHLDGRDLLGSDEADDLADGLHPTAAAYLRRGKRIAARAFAPDGPFR